MAGSIYNAVFGTNSNAAAGQYGSIAFADNTNIAFGTVNGTVLAANLNQKMGFWGVTPVIQPATNSELIGINGNAANAVNATNMNSNGNTGASLYNFNDVIKALKLSGILKA